MSSTLSMSLSKSKDVLLLLTLVGLSFNNMFSCVLHIESLISKLGALELGWIEGLIEQELTVRD